MATTQHKLPQSIFPDLPRGEKVVDPTGMLTQIWHLSLASLYQALQKNFSNEGFQMPQLTSNANSVQGDQIGYIESLYTPFIGSTLPQYLPNISGRIIYDYFASVPKMFVITFSDPGNANSTITAASWKTFTLT